MKELLFQCENLNYNIGYKKIFRDLSFQIFENEWIVLTGENGAGKSTLLRLIASSKKKNFQFFIKNQFRSKVSHLDHNNGLYLSLTLSENINFYKSILKSRISDEEIVKILDAFSLMKRLDDPVRELSEGMKRKAGILRAILPEPSLLLLDEPFNALDINSTGAFLEILEKIKRKSSILMVTHNLEAVSRYMDRNLKLVKGRMEG
jgi:ABC-type multidrug transport system ATPase subunit